MEVADDDEMGGVDVPFEGTVVGKVYSWPASSVGVLPLLTTGKLLSRQPGISANSSVSWPARTGPRQKQQPLTVGPRAPETGARSGRSLLNPEKDAAES